MLEKASGASLEIDSQTGDVSAIWEVDEPDPIVKMKMPDVIRAIGRGLAPNRAVKLLDDEVFLRMYDIREWVGRQPNQTRRMRSRLIGRNGRIRSLIEEMSQTEMAIYGSTVLVIGDEDGLALHGLEQDRKRMRIQSRSLDTYDTGKGSSDAFDALVPGLADARRRRERRFKLADARRRRERRFKSAQVDPDDEEEVAEMLELAEDESITYGEE